MLAVTKVTAQQPDTTALFDCGGQVRIEATPLPGYRFVRWSDGDTARVREIDVDGPIDLKAIFDVECYDVSVPVVLINDKMASVNRRQMMEDGLIDETLSEDNVRWYHLGVDRPIGTGFVLQIGSSERLKDYYVEVTIREAVAKQLHLCSNVLRGYPIPITDLPDTPAPGQRPLLPYAYKYFKDGTIYIQRNETLYTIDGQKITTNQ